MFKQQSISSQTRLCGLLGSPLGHSFSPVIHNHAFAACNLPYAYIPLPVLPSHLEAVVKGMRFCGFAGANVTIPHKQAVLTLCDDLSDLSRITGAVNTLHFCDGKITGTTTDVDGFLRALEFMNFNPAGKNIAILGTGGTARTLGLALAYKKIPVSITIVGRDAQKTARLVVDIQKIARCAVEQALFSDDSLGDALRDCSLIVNCTSVGMAPKSGVSPLPEKVLHPGQAVFDAIYNPAETELLRLAKSKGCQIQNGLRMLLYQALASFKIWTGVSVDETIFNIPELESIIK